MTCRIQSSVIPTRSGLMRVASKYAVVFIDIIPLVSNLSRFRPGPSGKPPPGRPYTQFMSSESGCRKQPSWVNIGPVRGHGDLHSRSVSRLRPALSEVARVEGAVKEGAEVAEDVVREVLAPSRGQCTHFSAANADVRRLCPGCPGLVCFGIPPPDRNEAAMLQEVAE